MKIAVLVKQVPLNDAIMDKKTGLIVRNGVKTNPYDYFAIETALRLKDKYNFSVDIYSMAPPNAKDNFKEYFALNVDNCFLVSDKAFGGSDVYATANTLAEALKLREYDIVICGRQTTDGDTSAIGASVAECLKIPSVMYAKYVDIKENKVIVERELTNKIEILEVTTPCVISVDKDIVTPRIPTLKNKLVASKKSAEVITLNDLKNKDINRYGSLGSKTKVVKIYEETPLEKAVKIEGTIDFLANFIAKKANEITKLS